VNDYGICLFLCVCVCVFTHPPARRGEDFLTDRLVARFVFTSTTQEDDLLRRQIERLGGPGNWTAIAEALPGRSSKSCRLRWCNQLNPMVKRGPFTAEEDATILAQHAIHGNKWAVISRSMPGRTDNQVKNRFNSTLRRLIASQKKDGERSSTSVNVASLAPASPRAKVPSRPQSRLGDQRDGDSTTATGSNGGSGASRSKRERSPAEMTSAPSGSARGGDSSPKRPRNSSDRGGKVVDKRARTTNTDPPARKRGETAERQGLDNLIQASLQELERLKKQKGEIFEWGAMPYGPARDCGTPEPARSDEDGVVPTLLAPKPKRGGFSVGAASDMYDWRSHSPALSAPFLAGLKRVDSLASLNGDMAAPSRPTSALSAPMSMQASSMLQSDSWYSRMLDNLGSRRAETASVAEVKTEAAEVKA